VKELKNSTSINDSEGLKIEDSIGTAEVSDYENSSSANGILGTTLTDSNTIFVNGSYDGAVQSGTRDNPYKTLDLSVLSDVSTAKFNVFIADGVYKVTSSLNINVDLNIIGESREKTILNVNGAGCAFVIGSDSKVSLSNLTIIDAYSLNYTHSSLGGAILLNSNSCL